MIWIVNAAPFSNQFSLGQKLPDPNATFTKDIDFLHPKNGPIRIFTRPSNGMRYSIDELESEIEQHYLGHHFFNWSNPRKAWYKAQMSVLFDFGGPELWKLVKYDTRGMFSVKKIPKDYFISRALS